MEMDELKGLSISNFDIFTKSPCKEVASIYTLATNGCAGCQASLLERTLRILQKYLGGPIAFSESHFSHFI